MLSAAIRHLDGHVELLKSTFHMLDTMLALGAGLPASSSQHKSRLHVSKHVHNRCLSAFITGVVHLQCF